MTTIGVLGGGQLGRMLAFAGLRIGHRFCFLDPAPDAPAAQLGQHIVAPYDDHAALDEMAATADVVTYEFENVPAASARRLEALVPVYPPPAALEVAQRRSEEKRWFEKVGVPTATFGVAACPSDLNTRVEEVGLPAVVKTSSGGYDGKGQVIVWQPGELRGLWDKLGAEELLVEQLVTFTRVLSIIAVRSRSGSTAFYPAVENHHRGGILRMSVAPAPNLSPARQAEAEQIAASLLDAFGYVGVLAVELFETRDGLLANEMAPRVHNSGHYSIDASLCSQFENHVRALCDLPLGSTEAIAQATMFNLISEVPDPNVLLKIPSARVHLYDKKPRAGRKLGHVTLIDPEGDEIRRVQSLLGIPPISRNNSAFPQDIAGS
jgi:5-(carboxyamino)imidazole ribonucleotide synthase